MKTLCPSSHGSVYLLRLVADGYPFALAGVEVCTRTLVV